MAKSNKPMVVSIDDAQYYNLYHFQVVENVMFAYRRLSQTIKGVILMAGIPVVDMELPLDILTPIREQEILTRAFVRMAHKKIWQEELPQKEVELYKRVYKEYWDVYKKIRYEDDVKDTIYWDLHSLVNDSLEDFTPENIGDVIHRAIKLIEIED